AGGDLSGELVGQAAGVGLVVAGAHLAVSGNRIGKTSAATDGREQYDLVTSRSSWRNSHLHLMGGYDRTTAPGTASLFLISPRSFPGRRAAAVRPHRHRRRRK